MNTKRVLHHASRLLTLITLVTLLLSGAVTRVRAGSSWTDLSRSAPAPRVSTAMASLGGDLVLLFGGRDYSSSYFGDTWVYDLSDNTWTNQSPAAAPSARSGHAMVYLGGDQVLLFGGVAGTVNNETWIYDLSENTWTHKKTSGAPSARTDHAMAFIGGDQVLLFGGWTTGNNNETWVYDLSANTWTSRAPLIAPSARIYHAMAYTGEDQVLLFGGYDGSNDDETWVYDLGDNA